MPRPAAVRYRLLTDEDSLQAVQDACPLFVDECRPRCDWPVADTGARHAAVYTSDDTLLAVLRQQPPGHAQPVHITALVVRDRAALRTLARFLGEFAARQAAHLTAVRIGGAGQTFVQLADGVTPAEVEGALRGVRFRPAPPETGGS